MENQFDIITENRGMIETLVLGTFLKELTCFGEYKVSEKDFIIDKTKFFFSLGRAMSKTHSELDQSSTLDFVNTNKKFKENYDEYGGWETIERAMSYGNENNSRAYVDNLAKNNLLISLDEKGFNMLDKIKHNGLDFSPLLDIFPGMTCREVEGFYEGLISACSVASISNAVKAESLVMRKEDFKKLKEKVNAGTPYNIMFEYTEKEVGLSDSEVVKYIYANPLMSTITNGLGGGGGITVMAGFSGIGKSTVSFFNYMLPMMYRGERGAIFSNEQGVQYFRNMLYSFIAANIFKYYDLSRTKIENGEFTDEEEDLMLRISDFLDARDYEESIKFIAIEEFEIDEIIRTSKEYVTHYGHTFILVDTFKSEDMSDSNYTGRIIENSKKLDVFGNKYKIKVFLTMQLITANEAKNSYLSAADLAEAKGVKNVCDLLFLMRKVVTEIELDPTNKKFYLRPYKLKKDRVGNGMHREYITLSPNDLNKDYRIIFCNKSRRGKDGVNLLLEFNGKTGRFKEIGQIEHISRGQLSY